LGKYFETIMQEFITYLKMELHDISVAMRITQEHDYDNPAEKLKAITLLEGQKIAIEKMIKKMEKL